MREVDRGGGPAFPTTSANVTHPKLGGPRTGMALRDWFAAQALNGMLAHSRNGHGYRPRDGRSDWHSAIAEEAYELADAMLRARNVGCD